MKQIKVLEVMPVVFTKDKEWLDQQHIAEIGSITLLPQDAVLAIPQQHITVSKPINLFEEDK